MYKELKGFRVYAIITAVALLFTGFLWGGGSTERGLWILD